MWQQLVNNIVYLFIYSMYNIQYFSTKNIIPKYNGICIINNMAKCAIWVIIPRVTGSEACNCTRRTRVLLQLSLRAVMSGIIASEQSRVVLSPQIAHLDMLLIANSMAQLTVIICYGWS